MDLEQTALLVARVKGIWQEQSGDDATVAAWHEVLLGVEYQDAVDAVMQRAQIGGERPSAALVCVEAHRVWERNFEQRRASQRAIGMLITDEQRRANLARLRAMPEYKKLMGLE